MTYARKPKTGVRRPGGRSSRYVPRRKVCAFCAEKFEATYKKPDALRRYVSDRGKIEPRRRTGNCAKHQRALALAIKRARHLALLPYTSEHIYQIGALVPRG
ncbi:MAG: 30S ribosomal protein S18 [Chloroflexi bacterium]|nr:30S ribosomal protein S18 [Chloroflexota bacterium]